MTSRCRMPTTHAARALFAGGALAFMLSAAAPAWAEAGPRVGRPAPSFSAVDTGGKIRSLAEFKGKTVVLEWTNHDCPFVRKHYDSGNMQALQKQASADGVVWLSIISSAPGEQGHVAPAVADKLTKDRKAAPTAVLFDPSGKVGKSYDARVTPHMYVIDKTGALVYMGGIDDKPTRNTADVPTAKPYVKLALAEVLAGKPVSTPSTRAYGCTVKYMN